MTVPVLVHDPLAQGVIAGAGREHGEPQPVHVNASAYDFLADGRGCAEGGQVGLVVEVPPFVARVVGAHPPVGGDLTYPVPDLAVVPLRWIAKGSAVDDVVQLGEEEAEVDGERTALAAVRTVCLKTDELLASGAFAVVRPAAPVESVAPQQRGHVRIEHGRQHRPGRQIHARLHGQPGPSGRPSSSNSSEPRPTRSVPTRATRPASSQRVGAGRELIVAQAVYRSLTRRSSA